jgi:signal transduction histidine kinase
MQFARLSQHLLPRGEDDPRLREHLRQLSAAGLATLAAVEIAVAALLWLSRVAAGEVRWAEALVMLGVGLVTAGIARRGGQRYARGVAAGSVWVASALVMLASGRLGVDDYVVMAITVLFLSAVATLPFLPWHAFALGAGIEAVYIVVGNSEVSSLPSHGIAHHIFLVSLAILATGIAASNYARRRAEFAAQQEAVRTAEALTGAQLRAQLAENAISIGKMAAALSHEINSPLGTLRSSIATLLMVADRMADAPPEARQRLVATRDDLLRSVEESAARIDDVSRRLRRFVSLDEAEIKAADLNDLLTDVTILHRDEIEKAHARLEFDLEKELPPLTCRPQLLTAAFSTLLSNALHAVNGDGRISIQTRGRGDEVEVTIRDNGKGMSAEEADTIFDPTFKVAEGRVSSSNWSLFNSRQIVYEHGGEIRLETEPGRGTAVHVTLPVV